MTITRFICFLPLYSYALPKCQISLQGSSTRNRCERSAEELFLLILIVIDLPFGPIDFLPNYFFSAQLKLRAAAYNHLQYKQLLLVAKVLCQFIKPDASIIL